jgi:hypothetical protein
MPNKWDICFAASSHTKIMPHSFWLQNHQNKIKIQSTGSSGTMTENVSMTQSFDYMCWPARSVQLGSPALNFLPQIKTVKFQTFGNFDFPTKILLIVKSMRLPFADLKS